MSSGKCVTSCVYLWGITQRCHLSNAAYASPIQPSPLPHPLLSLICLSSIQFCFSKMVFICNHSLCKLLRQVYITYQYAFEIHPYLPVAWLFFLLLKPIPLFWCDTVCLLIHLLKGILIASSDFGKLCIKLVQAYLRNIASSVPDNHNKASMSIKWVTWLFWIPNAYKSYVYTTL